MSPLLSEAVAGGDHGHAGVSDDDTPRSPPLPCAGPAMLESPSTVSSFLAGLGRGHTFLFSNAQCRFFVP